MMRAFQGLKGHTWAYACACMLTVGLFVTVDIAQAVPMLRLTSSQGGSTTITDQLAGDSSGIDGVVLFNGSITGWNINITTGLTKPALGSTTSPEIDISSVNVSQSGGTLTIAFTETDFGNSSAFSFGGQFLAAIGGTTAGSVSHQTYLDSGNNPFAQTTLLGDLGPFTPIAFSGSDSGSFGSLTGPFSLTSVVTVTHSGSGQATSFDANRTLTANPIPEPSSMLLLGSGLVGLGYWRWNKRTVSSPQ